jgi:apolipoprotein N-acyltransferase
VHADTAYLRFGDWFAWLALVALGLALALGQLFRRRRP